MTNNLSNSNIPPPVPTVAKPVPPLNLDSDVRTPNASDNTIIRQDVDDNSPLIEGNSNLFIYNK